MRTLAAIVLLGLAVTAAVAKGPAPAASPRAGSSPAASPAPGVSLRARLLDFCGALGNEGFKLRDGVWSGRLEAGAPQRLAVNLFAGNQYWFCAAVPGEARGLKIGIYDAEGNPLETSSHDAPGVTAAGVTAAATGEHFVVVESPAGASDFCLVYLFK